MKSRILIVIILLLALIFVVIYSNQKGGEKQLMVTLPIIGDKNYDIEQADSTKNESFKIKVNNCIDYSCNSVDDCKLVPNPYVYSECSIPKAINKLTSEACLNEISKIAIRASCILTKDYKAPEYEVVCVDNKCGEIKKY